MDDKFHPEDSASLAYVAPDADHDELAIAVERCRACSLYRHATQAVLGEGPTPAKMMIVGEQPGAEDDLLGRPWVGRAGRLLDDALEEAEIPRDQVYVTNAVKHFEWLPSGRRAAMKPSAAELHACRGWLDTELLLVEPEIIVCLGDAAARIFLGPDYRLTQSHGELMDGAPWARHILATFHPSALLRLKHEPAEYARARRAFTLDLAEAASVVSFRVARARRLSVRSMVG